MWNTVAALQPLLIGGVLLWAARVKLFSRRGRIASQTTALNKLLGDDRARQAYLALGACEAVVAVALLAPPVWWPEAAAATAMAAGFAAYLVYATRAAPDSSCGCMSAKHVPISWRGFTRAGWMLGAGIIALWASQSWATAIADAPLPAVLVIVAQAAVFVALSPEFDGAWLIPLRRLRVAMTQPLRSETDVMPLDASVSQLHHSELYRHVAGALRSDVQDQWIEDGWRIIGYAARVDGREATAAFAVPVDRYDPDAIKVAFVDNETAETILRLDGPPQVTEQNRPEWALEVATPVG